MENIVLKKRIMRQVYAIYVLRKVFNPVMYRVYLLVLFFGGIASFVSVSNVLTNMPRDFRALYEFVLYAFTHTELIVQVLTVGFVVTTLWLLASVAAHLLRQPRLAAIS